MQPLDSAKTERLLKACRAGYPLAAARAKARVSKAEVTAAGPAFAAEIEEACEEGRAIIAATLIERGLDPKLRDNGALRAGLELINGDSDAGLAASLNRMTEPAMAALVGRIDPDAAQRLGRLLGFGGGLLTFLEHCTEADDTEPPQDSPTPTPPPAASPSVRGGEPPTQDREAPQDNPFLADFAAPAPDLSPIDAAHDPHYRERQLRAASLAGSA